MKSEPYIEICRRQIFDIPEWAAYVEGKGGIPEDHAPIANSMALFLFYLGKVDHAREASLLYSNYAMESYRRRLDSVRKYIPLFEAALYRDLSNNYRGETELWKELKENIRNLEPESILKEKAANILIHAAYAHLKLGNWLEVERIVLEGLRGLENGYGIDKAPHGNSREYGLVNIVIQIAKYKLEPITEHQVSAQSALEKYKSENRRYGRGGYIVIFDLQFDFPDILKPILPGEDSEKD